MKLTAENVDNVSIVVVACDTVEASNAEEFQRQAKELLSDGSNAVLGMAQVSFVDSMGCSAILTCHRHVSAAKGELKVCSLSKPVRAIFEMIRVHRIIEIHNDRDEAIRAFSAAP